MSIKTSFNNSIFSAYKDLATFGPMERSMYERYTDIQNGQKNKDEKKEEKKSLSFMSLLFIFFLFFLLVVFILGYYGINPLFFMYN